MRIEKSLLIQRLLLVWFWVLTCTGFINDEFLGSNPTLKSASLLLTDVTILLLALWTIREKWDIALIISYFVISYWSTCIVNGLSWLIWLNGSRVFFGLLFVVPVLRYFWRNEYRYARFVGEVDKTLLIYLCVQAVCIVWQFVRYGAGDRVGGSLGFNYSALTSFSIYIVSYYLLHKRIDNNHFIYSLKENWYLIALLFPTFLNETKISFILIILYFFFLIKIDSKWLGRMAFIVPVAAVITGIGLKIYIDTVKNPFGETDMMEYIAGQDLEYEANAAEYSIMHSTYQYDIPRIAKLGLLYEEYQENPQRLYSGYGVGFYKGSTNFMSNPFAETFDWLIHGTNPYLFHVVIQLGIAGLLWAIVVFVSLFLRPNGIATHRYVNMQLFFLSYVLLMMVYADYWSELAFSFIVLLSLCLSWYLPDQGEVDVAKS